MIKIVDGSVRLDVGTPEGVDSTVPKGYDTGLITFNDKGAITSVSEYNPEDNGFTPYVQSKGDLKINVIFEVNNGAVDPQVGNQSLGVKQSIAVNLGTVGQTNGMTQFSSSSTSKLVNQDGYQMGYLNGFKIDSTGTVTGVYTNGQSRELAQIAVATFINPGGLEKAGDTNFVQSNNSGLAQVGPAETQNRGKVVAGSLEMSNVDLAEEFTDMITTQRGFQANSRTITTSDEMLRELLALKR